MIPTSLCLEGNSLLRIAVLVYHHGLNTVPEPNAYVPNYAAGKICEHHFDLGHQLAIGTAARSIGVFFNRTPHIAIP